jgi:aspartokinase/homoserine dehydrogenase 1
MKVHKLGGSSVGTAERLGRAIDRVVYEARQGPIAVVVSAMADATDVLLEATDAAAREDFAAAQAAVRRLTTAAIDGAAAALEGRAGPAEAWAAQGRIAREVRELGDTLERLLFGVSLVRVVSPETRDLVLSFGERISAATLAELVSTAGVAAVAVDARRWTVTDDRFGEARVDVEASRVALTDVLREVGARVPIHTGFLGRTPDGRTTTLGRNGSDYTATLLAALSGAEAVVVWTETSGVMTADPELVREAYPVAHLTYREALELANFGARMFHARTMIPLIGAGIPLTIKSLQRPAEPGTRIDARGADDAERPTSVTSLERLALLEVDGLRVLDRSTVGERVLEGLAAVGIGTWMATQSGHGQAFAVVVAEAEAERARARIAQVLALEIAQGDLEAPRVRRPVTLVTLVAEAMGQSVNVAGRMFGALGRAGIAVWGIAQCASARSIACVVDAADTASAVRAVHAAFNLAVSEVSVVLLGVGTVGSQLLAQVHAQATKLAESQGLALRVVGLADSERMVFDARGLDPSVRLGRDGGHARGQEPTDVRLLLERLEKLPVPILVDCTAADGMEATYQAAFARGVHVVAANKKPLTIPWAERQRLLAAAKASHRFYRYETTVGASLPVIETLMNLVRTGDRVDRVEGSLSGTLGYLSNAVTAGVPLSQAVREAQARGYTEPHPRDDLAGTDAARKALILARELGLAVELSDVEVEPFVPKAVLAEAELPRFYAALERADAAFAERIAGLAREGQVLRYLARIEPSVGRVVVGPVAVPLTHPATRLRATEAFVAFSTERYAELPLVVQGAGAGGAVTAAGVLADVLQIAQALRGR